MCVSALTLFTSVDVWMNVHVIAVPVLMKM